MEKLREKMFTLLLHAVFFIWMWAFSDDVPAGAANAEVPKTSFAHPGNVPDTEENVPSPGVENILIPYSYTDSTNHPFTNSKSATSLPQQGGPPKVQQAPGRRVGQFPLATYFVSALTLKNPDSPL